MQYLIYYTFTFLIAQMINIQSSILNSFINKKQLKANTDLKIKFILLIKLIIYK